MKDNKKEWKIPVGDIVIPAKVRYSKDISQSAKIIYGDIRALSFKSGFCNASNEYFGFLYGVDDKTISSWINELVKVGFVRSVILKKFERKLYPALLGGSLKKATAVSEKADKPPSDKPDNIDNKIDNIIISKDKPCDSEFVFSDYIKQVMDKSIIVVNGKKGFTNPARYFAAYFLKRKGLKFNSPEAVEGAMKRHYKAAKELGQFTSDMSRVSQAFNDAENLVVNGQRVNWGLETVIKLLTK